MADLNTNIAADLAYMQATLGITALWPTAPRPARVGIFGNSQAENNHLTGSFAAGTPAALQAVGGREDKTGFAAFAEMLTGGRVILPRSLNYGTSSENSDDMVARVDVAAAAMKAGGAAAVICICFTNDWGAITLEEAKVNAATIEAAFLSQGIKVIWLTEFPRGNAAATGTRLTGGDKLANSLAMHAWLHTRQDGARVFAVDAYSRLADPISTLGDLRTGMSTDYLHLENSGNYRVALALKPVLEALFPPANILAASNTDVYTAANLTGAVNLNPMFDGTSGALNSNPGSLATSWTAPALPGGLPSAVATFAKATASDGYPIQRVTLSGNGAASSQFWELLRRDTNIGGSSGMSVGSRIRASLELSLSAASTGLLALYAQIGANTTSSRAPAPAATSGNSIVPQEGFAGPLELPEIEIPSGTTAVRLSLWAIVASGSPAISAVVDVKRFALFNA